MKRKLPIPEDPDDDNIGQVLASLSHTGEITPEMIEAEVYAFLKQESPRMLRRLGKRLRNRFTGCVERIECLSSQGRNGKICINLNKLFAGFAEPTSRIRFKVSWQVSPMFGFRFWEADRRAALRLIRKLCKH